MKEVLDLPSQERLNELFSYDAATGDLLWRPRNRSEFKEDRSFNIFKKRFEGKPTGCRTFHKQSGRRASLRVILFARSYKAHRIIWKMLNGDIPDGMLVDHVNGDPFDNRLMNLRIATPAENTRNSAKSRRNRFGLKGVTQNGVKPGYIAQITVNRKNLYLGRFHTKGLAALAYAKAALRHHGKFASIR